MDYGISLLLDLDGALQRRLDFFESHGVRRAITRECPGQVYEALKGQFGRDDLPEPFIAIEQVPNQPAKLVLELAEVRRDSTEGD